MRQRSRKLRAAIVEKCSDSAWLPYCRANSMRLGQISPWAKSSSSRLRKRASGSALPPSYSTQALSSVAGMLSRGEGVAHHEAHDRLVQHDVEGEHRRMRLLVVVAGAQRHVLRLG